MGCVCPKKNNKKKAEIPSQKNLFLKAKNPPPKLNLNLPQRSSNHGQNSQRNRVAPMPQTSKIKIIKESRRTAFSTRQATEENNLVFKTDPFEFEEIKEEKKILNFEIVEPSFSSLCISSEFSSEYGEEEEEEEEFEEEEEKEISDISCKGPHCRRRKKSDEKYDG